MTLTEVLTIIAILAGPIAAVRITRYLDNKKEKYNRKLWLFNTLMNTRATQYIESPEHVNALNSIIWEFDLKNEKEKKIIEYWNTYMAHLSETTYPNWFKDREEKLLDLLYEMSKYFGYTYERTHIKTTTYSPKGHADDYLDRKEIITELKRVLKGDATLNVNLVSKKKNKQSD